MNYKHTYVRKQLYIDTFNWSKAKSEDDVLLENGRPYIRDAKETIFTDIFSYSNGLGRDYLEKKWKKEGGEDIFVNEDGSCRIFADWVQDDDFGVRVEKANEKCSYLLDYLVMSENDKEIVFLIIGVTSASIVKGNTSEHLLTAQSFASFDEAKKQQEQLDSLLKERMQYDRSYIAPFRKSDLPRNIWYLLQQEILKETGGIEESYLKAFHRNHRLFYDRLFGQGSYDKREEELEAQLEEE